MSGGPDGRSLADITRASVGAGASMASGVSGASAASCSADGASRGASSSSSQVDWGCSAGGALVGGGGSWSADGCCGGAGGSAGASSFLLRSNSPMRVYLLTPDRSARISAPEQLCTNHPDQVHQHNVKHH